ncbi:ejaculatory bulb-specific protein 3-like [Hyposmocoma kahamanoa]|uniref:ejaculatory bulb-specific protein 3-like n=1 Tax=Hyposmocoma kahamanoa TaxID=1477025 RepID=UPI000E6D893F|nr:ejaculatory bulb-specific protein 3-like [Hyposmocoma kahamanoa]
MKSFVVICFLAVVALALAGKSGQYTDRYDNLDLDEILNNPRILIAYVKCALETGHCSPEGKELKLHIREALETHCAKCTETQRRGSKRVISHLINNEPQYWKQLTNKYDPQGKFTKQYEQELRAARH